MGLLLGRGVLEVVLAIRGALIVREEEGSYRSLVTYKQHCASCGYVSAGVVSAFITPYGTSFPGGLHKDDFLCPICSNRQVVELRG